MSAPTILVVAATRAEAAHLPPEVRVVLTGIGKTEAAAATAEAIAAVRPDLVLNVGTAGALRSGATGLFLPSVVLNHDYSAEAVRALGHPAVDRVEIPDGDGTVLATGDLFVTDPQVRDELAARADLVTWRASRWRAPVSAPACDAGWRRSSATRRTSPPWNGPRWWTPVPA